MTQCHGSAGPAVPTRELETPLVVLLGRPNAGKSSLYNRLTGGDAYVGNFPGVTVDILEAVVTLPGNRPATVVDLPGLYSIEATVDPATDEGVARAFIDRALATGRPVVLVQVLDATQMALGLRLTRELLELPVPLILVATQRDALEKLGKSVNVPILERAIGVSVLAVSSREPATRDLLLQAVENTLATRDDAGPPNSRDIPKGPRLGAADINAIVARSIVDHGGSSKLVQARRGVTARADAVLLSHPFGALIFLGIMAVLFSAVFLIADPVSTIFEWSLGYLGAAVKVRFGPSLLVSFFTDAVLGGAGTVLAFLPQIVVLTMALEVLDASGYLSRGVFIADRVLRLLGLSGRSFVPLLIGHACAVPAIAATRVIRNPRERLVAILVMPLMTCSARIPTYALILGAFFSGLSAAGKAAIFVALYVIGGLFGLLASLVLRRGVVRGKSLPLVMEMPSYRWPQPRVVLRKGWRAAVGFARAAGTTILVVSAVLWLLLHIPMPGSPALAPDAPPSARIERSVAAGIGRAVEPVTRPLGFDWRINVGLIGAFGAREIMVGTLGVIHGVESTDDPGPLSQKIREARAPNGTRAYTLRTGLCLLAFFVVACQCMSTVVAIGRETKSLRWPIFVVGYTYALGYAFAFITGVISSRFGL